jgi:hypothetical protein
MPGILSSSALIMYKREVFQKEAVGVDRNSDGRIVVLFFVSFSLEGNMKRYDPRDSYVERAGFALASAEMV